MLLILGCGCKEYNYAGLVGVFVVVETEFGAFIWMEGHNHNKQFNQPQ
jgi:hypothetical protein